MGRGASRPARSPVIIHEPVRGSVPPAWFWSLPGIERIQAISDGTLPLPPFWRLLGIRPTHVGPGSGIWTMPATGWHAGAFGLVDLSGLGEAAVTGAAMTAMPPGKTAEPFGLTLDHFRPAYPQRANFLARARVVNWSRMFVHVEAELEDSQGRHIANARGRLKIADVTPPPPPPPSEIRRFEEPHYATPDPILRPAPERLESDEAFEQSDGIEHIRHLLNGTHDSLLGLKIEEAERGRISVSLPASETHACFTRSLSAGALASFCNFAGWANGYSMIRKGESFLGIEQTARFHASVALDGRTLRSESIVAEHGGSMITEHSRIVDADGRLVVTGGGVACIIDSAQRQKRSAPETKRVLATLLFTDIVDSTAHAERLADEKWRQLLDEHHRMLREAIIRCGGTEIDTAGDGFFVRFDAPGRAIECARAIRDGVKRLGIDLRVGIHTGECEVHGRSLAGMAVHIAARIQATAAPGEVLVSSTVKELSAGSGLRFEDRGEHALKGVPDPWRLYLMVG